MIWVGVRLMCGGRLDLMNGEIVWGFFIEGLFVFF